MYVINISSVRERADKGNSLKYKWEAVACTARDWLGQLGHKSAVAVQKLSRSPPPRSGEVDQPQRAWGLGKGVSAMQAGIVWWGWVEIPLRGASFQTVVVTVRHNIPWLDWINSLMLGSDIKATSGKRAGKKISQLWCTEIDLTCGFV